MKRKPPLQKADPAQAQAAEGDEGGEEFDLRKILDYGRFVLGAVSRRKLLVTAVLLLGLGGTVLANRLAPRTYHVESQLLAQKNNLLSALAGQSRASSDSPTRAAAEVVLRHDNLLALVHKADLVANWDKTRSPFGKLKDWAKAKLMRPPTSDEDKIDVLVWMLETRLSVKTAADWGGEGTVTFGLDWPDPYQAYRLVAAAQESFVEDRQQSDTSSISEAMSILVSRASTLRDEIEKTALSIQGRRTQRKDLREGEGERRRPRPREVATAPARPEGPSPGERLALDELKSSWETKKSQLKEMEDTRRRRVAELQTRLQELRATYADSHPLVIDTIRSIEALAQDTPQMADLRKEEARLEAEYRDRTGKNLDPSKDGALARTLRRDSILRDNNIRTAVTPDETDDQEMKFAKSQLRFQTETYDRLQERIDDARMELDTARVAFKYRYMVVRPAQVPRMPAAPNPKRIYLGGAAVTLLLSALLAVLADLRSGRVFQGWQVERAAGIPVIAEIPKKI